MERDPKDKVVIVTGAARGIGNDIVDQFLKNGAKKVFLLDIIEAVGVEATKTLNKTHGEGKAVFIKCDVTKDLEKIYDEVLREHQVDILVNNAAVLNEFSARQTIEVNLFRGSWEWHQEDYAKVIETEITMQTTETVGKAAVEVFIFAETGSVWVKENDEPLKLAPLCGV